MANQIGQTLFNDYEAIEFDWMDERYRYRVDLAGSVMRASLQVWQAGAWYSTQRASAYWAARMHNERRV